MTDFILAGGPFMWPLLACSVLIITISVERLMVPSRTSSHAKWPNKSNC